MNPISKQDAKAWHAEPAEAVLAAWSTSERGLSDTEVARRQHEYGPNVLPEKGPTLVWRIVHIGNCRSETRYAFTRSPLLNPVLFFGSLAAFLLHLAAMYVPVLQNILHAQPVGMATWAAAAGVSLLVLPAIEIHKRWWNRRSRLPSESLSSGAST